MPSKSSTIAPKSQVTKPLSALPIKVCANLCHFLLSQKCKRHELNAFDLCLIIDGYV